MIQNIITNFKNREKPAKLVGCIVLAVLALIVPAIVQNSFYLDILIVAYIFSILSLGFILVLVTGRLSLATAGLFAVGAYSSALIVTKLGLPFWVALPLAGVIASVAGMIIALISIKRSGITFIMLTWCFTEIIRLTISNQKSILGGLNGLRNIPPPNPISLFGLAAIEFTSKVSNYYLILCLLILIILFLWRLYGSRFGQPLRACQQDLLAQSVGINVFKYRLSAFCLGAFFSGVAGSFYAHYLNYLAPSLFTLMTSVNVLVYSVIGGTSNFIAGPLVGSIVLVVAARSLAGVIIYQNLIYSAGLIIVAIFLSRGVVSLPQVLLRVAKFYRRSG
jgi:branched-chain amino acid transport system permease protein